jgi:hypothetical protein
VADAECGCWVYPEFDIAEVFVERAMGAEPVSPAERKVPRRPRSLWSQPVSFSLTKPRSLLAKAPLSRPPFLDALVCHTRNDRARPGAPGAHRCNLRRAAILDKNLRLSAETLTYVRVSTPARRSTTKESFFW